MHHTRLLLLLVVISALSVRAQESHLSPEARRLIDAFAELQKSPDDPAVQERYLKAFPQTYKAFLALFDFNPELYYGAPERELYYQAKDLISVLPSLAKNYENEVGRLVVQLGKDAHWAGDAPNYLQQATVVYGDEHTKTFAGLLQQLSAGERANLVTFVAHAENFAVYTEYQTLINHLRDIGQLDLAKEFEAAREKRIQQNLRG